MKTSQNAGFSSFKPKSKYSLEKEERLRSKKDIEFLFSQGTRIKDFPILLLYSLDTGNTETLIQAAFAVSKKKFKKAVDRNQIKRWLREVHRLQKHDLYNRLPKGATLKVIYVYMDSKKSSFQQLNMKTQQLLGNLVLD